VCLEEWKDLRIDIKVCGKDVPEEEQAFVQFYPKVLVLSLLAARGTVQL
jgi:hypothetical protein